MPSRNLSPASRGRRGLLVSLAWVLVAALGFLASCRAEEAAEPAVVSPSSSRAGDLAWVDRVWRVQESNAAALGTAYIFLADRTLIVHHKGDRPGVGTWAFELGKLSIVEESQRYPVTVLELAGDRMRLRVEGPGEPVILNLRDHISAHSFPTP